MQCIAKTASGKCKNAATKDVEKKDLSHRIAHYCDEHAKPYLDYPNYFKVTNTKKH